MGIRIEATKILQRKWYEERESSYCNIWMSKKTPCNGYVRKRRKGERENSVCMTMFDTKHQALFSKIDTDPTLIIYIF